VLPQIIILEVLHISLSQLTIECSRSIIGGSLVNFICLFEARTRRYKWNVMERYWKWEFFFNGNYQSHRLGDLMAPTHDNHPLQSGCQHSSLYHSTQPIRKATKLGATMGGMFLKITTNLKIFLGICTYFTDHNLPPNLPNTPYKSVKVLGPSIFESKVTKT
jgi:hypothetical protein